MGVPVPVREIITFYYYYYSEIRKHNSNDAKCVELGWVCIPLVVETYGAWGQEAVKTFAQLASRLAMDLFV